MKLFKLPSFVLNTRKPGLVEKLEERILFDGAIEAPQPMPATEAAQVIDVPETNESAPTGLQFDNSSASLGIIIVDKADQASDGFIKSILDAHPESTFQIHEVDTPEDLNQLSLTIENLAAIQNSRIAGVWVLSSNVQYSEWAAISSDKTDGLLATPTDALEGSHFQWTNRGVITPFSNTSIKVDFYASRDHLSADHSLNLPVQSIQNQANSSDIQHRQVAADSQSIELVVIDSKLRNYEVLVDQLRLNSNVEIVLIPDSVDGIHYLAETLNGRQSLKAIHILSHGSDGSFSLGSANVTSETIESLYSSALEQIGKSLQQNGDLLLYACDFSSSSNGDLASRLLSQLTGADVATSSDATGAQELEGNWTLERHIGVVETQSLNLTTWNSLMAPPVVIVPSDQETLEDTAIIFDSTKRITVASNEVTELTVTLQSSHATLLLSSVAGLSFLDGTNDGQATIKFRGDINAISNALLNLELRPDLHFFGGTTLDVTVDDGSAVTTRSIDINIVSQNDAPVLIINPINIDSNSTPSEGGTHIFTLLDIQSVDPDNSPQQLVYVLNSLPAAGILRLNGNSVAVGTIFTQTQLANGRLTYSHDGSENHSDSFTLSVNDGAGGHAGPATVHINVTPLNDPMSVTASVVVYEGGSSKDPAMGPGKPTPGFHLEVNDVELDTKHITIRTLPAGGLLYFDGAEITQAQVSAGFTLSTDDLQLLEFVHDGIDDLGTKPSDRSFQIEIFDEGGGSTTIERIVLDVTINVISVNDDLQLVHYDDTLHFIPHGESYTLSLADMQVHDPDGPDHAITYTLENTPSHGMLLINGNPAAKSATFTQAQLIAGLVTFQHNETSAGIDRLEFTARDGSVSIATDELGVLREGDINSPPRVLTLNFDIEVISSPGNSLRFELIEGERINLNFTPGDQLQITSLPSDGILLLNGIMVSANQLINISATDVIEYVHGGSHDGFDSFQIVKNSEDVSVDIRVFLVNDAPVFTILQDLTTVYEGQSHVIDANWLSATDEEYPNPSDLVYTIVDYPLNGKVLLDSQDLSNFSTFTHQDVIDGRLSYVHDGGEKFIDRVILSLSDGSITVTKTLRIQAIPVNDRPEVYTNSLRLMEGETKSFSAASLNVGDPDGINSDLPITPDSPIDVRITSLPQFGRLTYNDPVLGVLDVAIGLEFSRDNINRLIYTHDGTENYQDTFNFEVIDNHSRTTPYDAPGTTPSAMHIEIVPVNDPPAVSTNIGLVQDAVSDRRVFEGGSKVITSDILFSIDPDSTDEQIQYLILEAPTNGTLLYNGAAIGVGSSFSQVDIQSGAVRYRHNGSETSIDKFVFRVDDSASNVAPTTVLIGIKPINDAPVISAPIQSIVNNPNFHFSGSNSIRVSDVDAGSENIRVQLSINDVLGQLSVISSGGTVATGIGTTSITLVGNTTDINATLATLRYLTIDHDSAYQLTIVVNDLGNTGADPSSVPPSEVPNLINTGDSVSEEATHIVRLLVSTENDAPTIDSPDFQRALEDWHITFNAANGNSIVISDSDHFGEILEVTLSATQGRFTLSQQNGISVLNGNASNSQLAVIRGTLDDINAALEGLTYVGLPNFNGMGTLSITANDLGNTGVGVNSPTSQTISILIDPINDAPTVSTPSEIIVLNGNTPIHGITINDIDYTDGGHPASTVGEDDFLEIVVRLTNQSGQPLSAVDHSYISITSSNGSSSVTVDSLMNGVGAALTIQGTLSQVSSYLSGLHVAISGPLVNNNSTYRIEVIADDRLRDVNGALDTSNRANGGSNISATGEATDVPTVNINPYAPLPPGLGQNVYSSFVRVISTTENEAPAFQNIPATINFTEGNGNSTGTAVRIAPTGTILDPELSTLNDWSESKLTIGRLSGANAEDVFSFANINGVSVATNNILLNGTAVAQFTNTNGLLTITFSGAGATNANVARVLQAVQYQNNSHVPPAAVTLRLTINDGDTDPDRVANPQGTGGELSAHALVTVNITPVNDPPSLSGLTSRAYREDGPAVTLAPSAVLFDHELNSQNSGNGNWGNATLTIQRQGGANSMDQFHSSGLLSPLTQGQPLNYNGVNVGTVITNSGGRLQIQFAEDTATNLARDVIRSITYSNTIQTLRSSDSSNVVLSWTVNDGDTDPDRLTNPQGTTGAKQVTVNQTIVLSGTNDAPAGTDFVRTINMNGNYILATLDFGFSDPIDQPDDAFINVVITSLPSQGTLTLNGVPVTIGQSVSVANINANGLVWTPPANSGGTNYANFTFQVQDNGGTANGGVDLDPTPNTALFHVNMPPELISPLQDQMSLDSEAITLDLSSHFMDPEGHSYTFTAANLPPGLSIGSTTGIITGTIGSSASTAGSYPVSIELRDQLGATRTVTFNWGVTNPAPIANNDSLSVNENSPLTGSVIGNDSDPDGDSLMVSEINGMASNVGIAVTGSNGGLFTIQPNGSFSFSQGTSFDDLPMGVTRSTYVEYTLRDADGATDKATFLVTVVGMNDAPTSTAIPDQVDFDRDVVDLDVATFFSDVDQGDQITFQSTSTLPLGLSLNPTTGRITGTIDRSASVQAPNGEYLITIVGTDRQGASSSQTFTWRVINPTPIALNDSEFTNQNRIVNSSVITNDSDPDGDPLFVGAVNGLQANVGTIVAGSNGGQFTILADGSYTFDPGTDFNYLPLGEVQQTTIQYTLSDGQGGTAIATVTISVTGLNDAPVSTAIPNQLNVDYQEIHWDASTHFSDVDTGTNLKFSFQGALPPGLTLNVDTGVISGRITSDASVNGPYQVRLIATDNHGISTEQSFTWTIVNPGPTAVVDLYATDELTPIVRNAITPNDTDPDHDSLSVYAINGTPANVGQPISGDRGGVFTVEENGNVHFDPGTDLIDLALNEQRTTSVTYTITDGEGGFSTSTISVTVTGLNTEPTSTALPNLSNHDWDVVDISIANHFADADLSDNLIYSIETSLPPGLTLDPTTGSITGRINSDASVNGPYLVTVVATDPQGARTSQSFTWSVTNLPPIALNDDHQTFENAVLTSTVKGNDSDPDLDTTHISAVNGSATNVSIPISGSSGGQFTVATDGSYTFDPQSDFDSLQQGESRETYITYTLSDGQGGFDTATLTVTVWGVNDTPTSTTIDDQFNNDSDTVVFDVSDSFSDPDTDDPLTFSDNGSLPPGLTIDSSTGIISGTIDSSASSDGPYHVTITATDSQGETRSETFTWNVANIPPVAVNDFYTISGVNNSTVVGNAINNDSDQDNDQLTTTPQTGIPGSNGGIFTIAPDGTVTFDPNGDFDHIHVKDSVVTTIEYQLVDADGATSTATISITVIGTNNSPVAVDDFYELNTTSLTGKAFDNDSDPEGHAITGEVTVPPQHGTLQWNPDGSFSYQPGPSFIGADQFTYTIYDIHGASSTAVVHITRPFAWDSFRNESIPNSLRGMPINHYFTEQLASHQLSHLASNPILAGYAAPGTVLRGKIYDLSGGLIAEVKTTSNAAGNWVMNFYLPIAVSNPIVIIEHIATEQVILDNHHHFRLTESTYRSLQLGVEHRDQLNIGSILADRPSLVLQRMHQQNLYPLTLK